MYLVGGGKHKLNEQKRWRKEEGGGEMRSYKRKKGIDPVQHNLQASKCYKLYVVTRFPEMGAFWLQQLFLCSNQKRDIPGPATGGSGLWDFRGSSRSFSSCFLVLLWRGSRNIGSAWAVIGKKKFYLEREGLGLPAPTVFIYFIFIPTSHPSCSGWHALFSLPCSPRRAGLV